MSTFAGRPVFPATYTDPFGNGRGGLSITIYERITYTDGVTTSGDHTLVSDTAGFTSDDEGKEYVGQGFPSGTTIETYISPTTVEMSLPASSTGTGRSFQIAARQRDDDLATVYADRVKSVATSNPYVADADGNTFPYLDPGDYDAVTIHGVTAFSVLPDHAEPVTEAQLGFSIATQAELDASAAAASAALTAGLATRVPLAGAATKTGAMTFEDEVRVEADIAVDRMLSRNMPEYNMDHPSWKQSDDPAVDAGPILRRIAAAVDTEAPNGARIVFNAGSLYRFTTAVSGEVSVWEGLRNLWFEGKGARIVRDQAFDGAILRFNGCVNTTIYGFADVYGGYELLDNQISNKRFIRHTSGADGVPSIGLTIAHCNIRNFTSSVCQDGGGTEPPDRDVKNARTVLAFNRFEYCDEICNVGNLFGARQAVAVGNQCYRCIGPLLKTDNDTTNNQTPGGYEPIRTPGTHILTGNTWQEHGRTSRRLWAPAATTGTFTVTVLRETSGVSATTAAIPVTATAADVKAAIEALPNVGVGGIDYAKNGPVNTTTGVTLLFSIALRYLHVTVTNSTSGGSVTAEQAVTNHALTIAPRTRNMRIEGLATDLVETRFRLTFGPDQKGHIGISLKLTIADSYGELSPIRLETDSVATGTVEGDIDIDVTARNLGAGAIDFGLFGDAEIQGLRINAKVTNWASHSYSASVAVPQAVHVNAASAKTNTITISGEFHRYSAAFTGSNAIWARNFGATGRLTIEDVKVHGPAASGYVACRVDNGRALMRNNLWNGYTVDLDNLTEGTTLDREDYGTDGLVTLDNVIALAIGCRGKRVSATRLFRVRTGSTLRHVGCDFDGTFTTQWPIHLDGGTVTAYSYTKNTGQLVASGGFDANSAKLVNLANGTAAADAVNKAQLDAVAGAAAAPHQDYTTAELRVLDTTPVLVPELSFPVLANTRYYFEFHVLYDTTTANRASFGLSTPSGATFTLYGAPASAVSASSGNADAVFGVVRGGRRTAGGARATGAAAAEVMAVLKGSLLTGASGGTVQLDARKNTNTDTATPADDLTIYADSLVRAFVIPA